MKKLASAFTPSFYAPQTRRRRRKSAKARIEELAMLVGQARDMWTGEPLDGKDLKDWLKMQAPARRRRQRLDQVDNPADKGCKSLCLVAVQSATR